MSKFNLVDAISYVENVCFELLHSEEKITTIGSQTFNNLELNDNIVMITQMMKFVMMKEMNKYIPPPERSDENL